MAPFRPTNLNKRAYPGNSSIVGPTCCTSCAESTSVCCSSTNTKDSCTCFPLDLGCRCSYCACPCCNICCSCTETLCTRNVPSGIYSANQQWDASVRDTWVPSSCTCDAPTCLCCTDVGVANIGNLSDCKSFFICCQSPCKWFVAPNDVQVQRTGFNRLDACIQSCQTYGNCSWFLPDISKLQNPGFSCRTYWDTYVGTNYWSSSQNNTCPYYLNMSNGSASFVCGNSTMCARAFRCTLS